jgi:1,4-alpha-glucan branching enzyme
MQPQMIWEIDPWLEPYQGVITSRRQNAIKKENDLLSGDMRLTDFANAHHYFGMHRTKSGWVFREWAPNATAIYLTGFFSDWETQPHYALKPIGNGVWEGIFQEKDFSHEMLYKLSVHWPGGHGERLPAYATRVVQDEDTKIFSAQIWQPEKNYQWQYDHKRQRPENPLIYEAHTGMATEAESVGSFDEFREKILPRIKKSGYNTLQLMAIQEHPYYGSFGYHVSNFFAVSSRFGTPDAFKKLVDEAHKNGIMVIIDLVHSHSVKNVLEGLGLFDGTPYQYFHDGPRREHQAWDSLCFNYGKNEVLHFLLSNIKYWLEEYHCDGFRFDGVTSMLYYDHGLGKAFTNYDDYFNGHQDEDAITYFMLANKLIHEVNPDAISVAEEMSGYPGLAYDVEKGGLGFDFRLAMGIPDFWIKLIKEQKDEDWHVGQIMWELSNKRAEEKTISYAESHDQALVGDKTIIFRLIDKEMYWHMDKASQNLQVDRGIALHKMIRMVTILLSGGGYLNFMGNEFGHPEWIDFPREGNNWSFKYARRQWSLVDNDLLRYEQLDAFDKAMIKLVSKHINLTETRPISRYEHIQHQILVVQRAGLVFVFNFNPVTSFSDYEVPVPKGKYKIVLDSDAAAFGGFERLDNTLIYKSYKDEEGKEKLKLYIPNRTVFVLKRTR